MTRNRIIFAGEIMVMVLVALFVSEKHTAASDVTTGRFLRDRAIEGKIAYILDGDSFVAEIGGTKYKIRLYGIDCPEHDQFGGDEAKVFLNRLVQEKKILLIPKDIDKYGRLVAVVENNGKILNEQLVSSGHAWVYTYFCRESMCSRWKELESRAREQGRGVWKKTHPVAPWVWKKKK